MRRSLIERRLTEVSTRLKALREDLRVADEQHVQLLGEADDARLRALVSETPLADREHREAQRHSSRMQAHIDAVRDEIGKLEVTQDELLDEMTQS